ncbi:hypothetical protein AAFN86_07680 [Roseomonas sp. CAU 1739]|uniref:hypothetical protein n=1 Tax=Roseomonas sp. CAU 1739 TaxID=3140364 RepID=UPI00325BB4EF
MHRVLMLLALLLATPALAQGLPTTKPPPLGAPMNQPPPLGAMPADPAPRCAAPLANACLAQQGACQVACPPMWSMNPAAPAFTPTDRAGCMQRCFQQYLSCRRLHGC